MRSIPFLVLLASLGCAEEEPEPVCPDVCEDRVTVETVGVELSFAELTVSFDGVELIFTCRNGAVKGLSDSTYDVSCDDESFTIDGVSPALIDVSLNGVYSASLQPVYSSEHPSAECTDLCMGATVEWDVFGA